MANQLKPCPFCGGPAEKRYSEIWGMVAVSCKRCGAIGPTWTTWGDESARAWNERCDREPDGCRTCAWFRRDDTSTLTWCDRVHQERKPGDYCSRWIQEGDL